MLVAAVCGVSACGGLTGEASQGRDAAHVAPDAAPPDATEANAGSGGSQGTTDATTRPRDVNAEPVSREDVRVTVDAPLDVGVVADVVVTLDAADTTPVIEAGGVCGCSTTHAFVELGEGDADPSRLAYPYALAIHCHEDAPLVTLDECSGVVRLSACAGSSSAPPCVYFGLDGTALKLGHFVDAGGVTVGIRAASLHFATVLGGIRTGQWLATLDDGRSLGGAFSVCARRIAC